MTNIFKSVLHPCLQASLEGGGANVQTLSQHNNSPNSIIIRSINQALRWLCVSRHRRNYKEHSVSKLDKSSSSREIINHSVKFARFAPAPRFTPDLPSALSVRLSMLRESRAGHNKLLNSFINYITIRYDTRCYFNVRSKADIGRLNLRHGNDN